MLLPLPPAIVLTISIWKDVIYFVLGCIVEVSWRCGRIQEVVEMSSERRGGVVAVREGRKELCFATRSNKLPSARCTLD